MNSIIISCSARVGVLLGAVLTACFLTSCSTGRIVQQQFRDANIAYAQAQNDQMLLNLARLDNDDPAYYLAIGTIYNHYTFSSATDANIKTPDYARLASLFRALSVDENLSAKTEPEFQFIPINNETVAKQVLQPMSTEVFTALYLQDYPIDQLMRVLIERIETPPLPNGKPLVLVNSPTRGTIRSYARFLRVCDMLRQLQKNGYLQLEGRPEKMMGQVSFGGSGHTSQPDRQSAVNTSTSHPGDKTSGRHNPSAEESYSAESGGNPTLKDFSDAEASGFSLRRAGNQGWALYPKNLEPVFVLKGNGHEWSPAGVARKRGYRGQLGRVAIRAMEFLETNEVSGKVEYRNKGDNWTAITNLVSVLNQGVTIQTSVTTNIGNATRLVLRSFDRAMGAAASEQDAFSLLRTNREFTSIVPPLERRPILKTVWTDTDQRLEPPLVKLNYAGKTYQITDPILDPLNPAAHWNHNVFRLLVALDSQVTVDISKFQRQVIELQQ